MKRVQGTGSVYLRGRVYWISYTTANEERRQESTGLTNKKKAYEKLAQRLGQKAPDTLPAAGAGRATVRELADDLLRGYRTGAIRGLRSIDWSERRWRLHLAPFFADMRASAVGTDQIMAFIETRQAKGASNAEINRELAFLSRAYRIARLASPPKVTTIPPFPRLKEAVERKTFLEDADYAKLAAECSAEGAWLRAMLAIGATYGWRKSEVLHMKARQVDLRAGRLHLDVGTTKNEEARQVAMTNEVRTVLTGLVQGKGPEDPVFERDGVAIRDFRGAWANACSRAGVPELHFHDLRRTAARNLRRLGLAEGVIMKTAGWKTRSVFDRYNIVDSSDMVDVARRIDAKQEAASYNVATLKGSATPLKPN